MPNADLITFRKGDTLFSFLRSGDIYEFIHENYIINLFQGSPKEGSANNIYLRVFGGDRGTECFPC